MNASAPYALVRSMGYLNTISGHLATKVPYCIFLGNSADLENSMLFNSWKAHKYAE